MTTDSKSASASKGEHLDALDAVIQKLRPGDRVIVTDSSRLDRRDNLTSQVQTMLAIRGTGAQIVSLAPGEETFGQGDDLAGWITTIVKQSQNADKSRTVKSQTWRGVKEIIANQAHHGTLPAYWESRGARYQKEAVCSNPPAVRDIFQRASDGEPLASIARVYSLYPAMVRRILEFEAAYTGVERCRYTHEDQTHEWLHQVDPVVSPDIGWKVRQVLSLNKTTGRGHKGGRPLSPGNWVNGVLDCPACGGQMYLKGRDRLTLRLRCCGRGKARKACGVFRPIDADPVLQEIDELFQDDDNRLLAYQRTAGNAHVLESLKAELAEAEARLGTIKDRAERRLALTSIESLEDRIESFTVIPDTFEYAETGKTVGDLWRDAADQAKKDLLLAVKRAGGVVLDLQGQVRFLPHAEPGQPGEVIDLGHGLCFRRRSRAL